MAATGQPAVLHWVVEHVICIAVAAVHSAPLHGKCKISHMACRMVKSLHVYSLSLCWAANAMQAIGFKGQLHDRRTTTATGVTGVDILSPL